MPIMSKVNVLFFAADPASALPGSPSARLLLDEDVRRIRQKVRAADFRDHLEFDVHWAARADDLLQALNENPPQVVHFSGHGGSEGLVLVGADGEPHPVDEAALSQLFHVFRGDIRLVVLNACFSLPQAQAIAQEVGCAIGTRGEISDEAALTFGGAFYSAIAFGRSVQAAFEQARAALALEHGDGCECPELVVRPGVDPARIVLIPPHDCPHDDQPAPPPRPARPPRRRRPRRQRWMVPVGAALVLGTGTALILDQVRGSGERQADAGAPRKAGAPDSVPVSRKTLPRSQEDSSPAVPDVSVGDTAAAATRSFAPPADADVDLAIAMDLYRAKNYTSAHPFFEKAARAGRAEAMGYLGVMYLEGQGTARDPVRAAQWLTRAAAAGDARGMNALGVAHQLGAGVERSYPQAMRWYRAAQELGNAQAMNNIGTLYRQGLGVAQNYAEAMRWYERAATAGSAEGMVNMASMYEEGLAGPRNVALAWRWYRNAAEAGSLLGMVRLGLIYLSGTGVAADYAEARVWFTRAAEAGSADGMYNLGVLYFEGRGVPRDRTEAIHWFRLAADAGSPEAVTALDRLDQG